jgi:hypothetical protein
MTTQNKEERTKHEIFSLKNILLFFLIPSIVVLALLFFDYKKNQEDQEWTQKIKSRIEVLEAEEQLLKLRTIESDFEIYRTLDKSSRFFDLIPIGGAFALIYLQGKLVGRVNLKDVTVAVDGNQVTLYFPPAEVESQLHSTRILSFQTNGMTSFLNPGKKAEFLEYLRNSDNEDEKVLEITNRIRKRATEEAQKILKSLLESLYPNLKFKFRIPPSRPGVDRYL